MSDNQEIEARLSRFQVTNPPGDVWTRISSRIERRGQRFRIAQWAAVILLSVTVLLRVATGRIDRALSVDAVPSPVDLEALTAALRASTEPLP